MYRTACIILCVVALACGEKRRLQERLAALERQHADLSQRLEARKNTIRESEHRLDALNADLASYNTDVHTFIEDHRIAAECIRASRSTWGESNAFSGEVSNLTKVGAAFCAVALFNGEFAQEVTRVAEKLREADGHVKGLKEQITATQRTIDAERTEVEGSHAAVERIAVEIADARRQLERE